MLCMCYGMVVVLITTGYTRVRGCIHRDDGEGVHGGADRGGGVHEVFWDVMDGADAGEDGVYYGGIRARGSGNGGRFGDESDALADLGAECGDDSSDVKVLL